MARYTIEEDLVIKKLLGQGKTYRQIALVLGRTASSIEARVALKFGRRKQKSEQKWSEEERQKLKELVEKKTPRKKIAEILNRSFPSIERGIARLVFTKEPQLARRTEKVSYEDVRRSFEELGFVLLESEYTQDHIPLRFRCPEGHEGTIAWLSWKKTKTCPVCRIEKQKLTIEHVRSGFAKEGYSLLEESYINANVPLKYKCPEGHEHYVTWGNFYRGVRCPQCSKSTSGPEKELMALYQTFSPRLHDKEILETHELDLLFTEQKIAIEYCGLFWHSSYWPDKVPKYHYNKMKKCNEKGIRLITVFEDEWLNNRQLCLSRINAALGVGQKRIYARKCQLKEISTKEAKQFLQSYHLQGSSGKEVAFGLFYEGSLVSVMTLGKPSRAHVSKKVQTLELKRFASLPNMIVIGGASKLFKAAQKYAKENSYGRIVSYCDLRWGTGNVYKKLGMELSHTSKYTPHYTDFVKRWRNQRFAGNKDKSERERVEEAKVYKIYDCGHQVWEYKLH